MIRRELAKDPKLANESWDRFLPQFRKRHLTSAQKSAKKRAEKETNAEVEARVVEHAAAHPNPYANAGTSDGDAGDRNGKKKEKKKKYTPFPPPQQPRKVDIQLETGEYFLKPHEKQARENAKRKQKVRDRCSYVIISIDEPLPHCPQQAEATAARKAERAEAFVVPVEATAPTIEEKQAAKKRKHQQLGADDDDDAQAEKKKKRKSKRLDEST